MRSNRESKGADPMRDDSVDSAFIQTVAILLAGVATGWLVVALPNQIGAAFGCVPRCDLPVTSACLCALAMGVRLPRRLAAALAYLFWSRARDKKPDAASKSLGPDRQLLWMILAASAMLAGFCVALSPVAARAVAVVYSGATSRFFWMHETHVLLVAGLSFGVVSVALLPAGVVLVCLNQLSGLSARRPDGVLPRFLVGAAIGSALVSLLADRVPRVEVLVICAALPFFLVAILAVRRSGVAALGCAGVSRIAVPPPPPASSVTAPLQFTVTITTAAVASTVVLWGMLLIVWAPPGWDPVVVCSCVVLAAAVGMTGAGSKVGGDDFRVATRIALIGLLSIVAAMSAALMTDRTGGVAWLPVFALGVAAVCINARALAGTRHLALRRTVTPNATATRLLFERLWWPGCAMLASALFLPASRQALWVLVGLGLAVAASGAVVFLDDATHPLRARMVRAALVLLAAIGLTIWIPWVVTRWAIPDDRASVATHSWARSSGGA